MAGMIWGFFMLGAIGYGLAAGNGPSLAPAAIGGAAQALELLLSMAGIYMFWLEFLEIAQSCGLTKALARMMARPLGPLFRGIDPRGDTMGRICLNLSANALGLGNAATPFGLAAMESLARHNRGQNTPSDAMVMLVVLNCGAVQLMPSTIIALRAAAGSPNPGPSSGLCYYPRRPPP